MLLCCTCGFLMKSVTPEHNKICKFSHWSSTFTSVRAIAEVYDPCEQIERQKNRSHKRILTILKILKSIAC